MTRKLNYVLKSAESLLTYMYRLEHKKAELSLENRAVLSWDIVGCQIYSYTAYILCHQPHCKN